MRQITANRPKKARRKAKMGEDVDFRKLRTVSILKHGELPIYRDEAIRRARANPLTNNDGRFARKIVAAGIDGQISFEAWHVGQHVIFVGGSRGRHCNCYVWCVARFHSGFRCFCIRYSSFTGSMNSDGCLLRLDNK